MSKHIDLRLLVLIALALPTSIFASGTVPPCMVIVTDDAQADAYKHLADYKTSIGIPTEVHTVSTILSGYPAVDAQSSIRAFLQNEFQNGALEYVLIGGNAQVVPFRLARSEFFGGADIPSDYYYSDLDGDWDANGNSVYGEFDDGVELNPDVFVGRLPSGTPAEADLLVNKVLAYQQNPPAGFVETGLFGANVLFPQYWQPGDPIQLDGAVFAQEYLDGYFPVTISVNRLYQNDTAYPGSQDLTGAALITAMNAGSHFLFQTAHGTQDLFIAGEDQIGVADILGLTNGDRTGIFLARTGACAFPQDVTIADAWVLAPNGGGVATFGSTAATFVSVADRYDEEMFRLLWQTGETRLGRLSGLAKLPLVPFSESDSANRWGLFSFMLVGDPEMAVWTEEPGPLSVSHSGVYVEGDATYPVSIQSDGQPVEGVRVTLCQPGGAYSGGFTDASGMVDLAFAPEYGPFTVGVWKQNFIPVVEEAVAASTAGIPDAAKPVVTRSYPNPFRASTVIAYDTAGEGPQRVLIQVFDLRGRMIRTLLDCSDCLRGSVAWDGLDASSIPVPQGMYTYRVMSAAGNAAGKLMFMR